MKKWVKLLIDESQINLTDEEGLVYLNYEEEDVQIVTNTQERKGIDGLLVSSNTFSPFKLTLRFVYSGMDINDYHLFKTKLRGIIYQRLPYYVIHSDLPGRKYAVLPDNISIEDKFGRNGTFDISFSVYKGYSESLNTTDEEFIFESNWQFENGIPLDFNPNYHNSTNQFVIWNGSTDIIDPRIHEMKVLLNLDANDGFELVNYTTGDVFRYNKSIDKNIDFILDGMYAYRDGNRCGIDTNRGIIRLNPGKNLIRIKGDVNNINSVFKFPFIYR